MAGAMRKMVSVMTIMKAMMLSSAAGGKSAGNLTVAKRPKELVIKPRGQAMHVNGTRSVNRLTVSRRTKAKHKRR